MLARCLCSGAGGVARGRGGRKVVKAAAGSKADTTAPELEKDEKAGSSSSGGEGEDGSVAANPAPAVKTRRRTSAKVPEAGAGGALSAAAAAALGASTGGPALKARSSRKAAAASTATASTKRKASTATAPGPSAAASAGSPYSRFVKAMYKRAAESLPAGSKGSEVMKALGVQWRALGADDKAQYSSDAAMAAAAPDVPAGV